MPVIINELEVVVEREEPRESDGADRDRPQPAPALRPMDITDVVERQARLRARVAAH